MKVNISKQKQPDPGRFSDCFICGAPLLYSGQSEMRTCAVCGKTGLSNAVCAEGHFVCDACHIQDVRSLLTSLALSTEKDPVLMIQRLMSHPSTHLHGPEHHCMVPCVLLTAYRNCGGDIELEKGLREAVDRGRGVPGGACGFWGACGAAVGAGIFASIVTGSSPLNKKAWALPNMLTARCLERMAEIGGPRCCKRSSYIAIETAAAFSAETLGIAIPVGSFTCKHQRLNKECIGSACPYFGRSGKDAGI